MKKLRSAAFLLTAAFCFLTFGYADGWHIDTVDSAGNTGLYTSLAIDGLQHSIVSYYDATNGNLKFAFNNGSTWTISTVDSAGDVGQYSSLAIDYHGNSHIAYYDATNHDLKYAKFNGSSWLIQTVDSNGDVGQYCSLGVKPATELPRISYYDATNGDLKVAEYNGSAWVINICDSGGDVGKYTSILVFDPDESSQIETITYFDQTTSALKRCSRFTEYGIQPMFLDTIDSWGDVGEYSSVVSQIVFPWLILVSYYDATNGNLKVATAQLDDYTYNTIDTNGNVGLYTSMVNPSDGYQRIAYYDATNGNLKLAHYSLSGWEISIVDGQDGSDVGKYTSLKVTSYPNSYSRISYYDATNGDLKFASFDPYVGVDLNYFQAENISKGVKLNWSVSDLVQSMANFNIKREEINIVKSESRAAKNELTIVNQAPICGLSPFSYIDSGINDGISYRYYLECVFCNGEKRILGDCSVNTKTSLDFSLESVSPSPAHDYINCKIISPSRLTASIKIVDLSGRMVAKRDSLLQQGINSIRIDTSKLRTGIYFIAVSNMGYCSSKRFIIDK